MILAYGTNKEQDIPKSDSKMSATWGAHWVEASYKRESTPTYGVFQCMSAPGHVIVNHPVPIIMRCCSKFKFPYIFFSFIESKSHNNKGVPWSSSDITLKVYSTLIVNHPVPIWGVVANSSFHILFFSFMESKSHNNKGFPWSSSDITLKVYSFLDWILLTRDILLGKCIMMKKCMENHVGKIHGGGGGGCRANH